MNTHEIKQLSLFEKQESLDVLNYQIRACEKCSLSVTRKHALIGKGNINACIMFVALSPGVKEDSQNRMFVGPSGQAFINCYMQPELTGNRSL